MIIYSDSVIRFIKKVPFKNEEFIIKVCKTVRGYTNIKKVVYNGTVLYILTNEGLFAYHIPESGMFFGRLPDPIVMTGDNNYQVEFKIYGHDKTGPNPEEKLIAKSEQ